MDQQQPEATTVGFHSIQKFNNYPSADYKTVYANNTAAVSNFFDLSLIFGEVAGVDGDTMNVEQKVKVAMAVPHAKLLLLLLWQQIASYETTFGEIKLPPEVVPPQVASFLSEFANRGVQLGKTNEGG